MVLDEKGKKNQFQENKYSGLREKMLKGEEILFTELPDKAKDGEWVWDWWEGWKYIPPEELDYGINTQDEEERQ